MKLKEKHDVNHLVTNTETPLGYSPMRRRKRTTTRTGAGVFQKAMDHQHTRGGTISVATSQLLCFAGLAFVQRQNATLDSSTT